MQQIAACFVTKRELWHRFKIANEIVHVKIQKYIYSAHNNKIMILFDDFLRHFLF